MKLSGKYNFRKILVTVLWIAVGSAAVVLLVAAVRKKDSMLCKGVEININGVSTNFFIDKTDVQQIIAKFGGSTAVGKPIRDFNLVAMEMALKKDPWIQKAEMYFDNNTILQVSVLEREPVARLFTSTGNTFYIDSSNKMLPLSEKFSARVPVFTNFPTEAKILSKADSSLLNDVKNISMEIQADSFLMAMIDQVDINNKRNFEMIPKLGNQVIIFGDGSDIKVKFNKLELFYKKVITKVGWKKYSSINLEYRNQVVAKIKGKDDVSADSLRTVQMMEVIAANAARFAEDSTHMIADDRRGNDSSMIQQSLQRDEPGDAAYTDETPKQQGSSAAAISKQLQKQIAANPPVKPAAKPVKKPVVKPVSKTPVTMSANRQPKMIMPKKNEY